MLEGPTKFSDVELETPKMGESTKLCRALAHHMACSCASLAMTASVMATPWRTPTPLLGAKSAGRNIEAPLAARSRSDANSLKDAYSSSTTRGYK
jgi:hypothetical protein